MNFQAVLHCETKMAAREGCREGQKINLTLKYLSSAKADVFCFYQEICFNDLHVH